MIDRCSPSVLLVAVVAACSHSDPFPAGVADAGPATTGSDVLLTRNPEQNYWPILSEDGSAVLYAFVDASQPATRNHRCIGAMRVGGGTRFWQWCDNRGNQADSSSSFPAYALGFDGRLLYAEAVVPKRLPFQVPQSALWLADSAAPFRRRLLGTLPVTLGDSVVNWFADLRWTGPGSFIGIGQRMVVVSQCDNCSGVDSAFFGETLVSGTINDRGAALQAISGTAGATGFALVDNGASIVFIRRDDGKLLKVPVGGGNPAVVAIVAPGPGAQLLGVSCNDATCVVAHGENTGPFELRRVTLSTGTATTVLSSALLVLSLPVITSAGDVIIQEGPGFGHLSTSGSTALTLHLIKGLLR